MGQLSVGCEFDAVVINVSFIIKKLYKELDFIF